MRIASPDFNPLRRAEESRAYAKRASFLPESITSVKKTLDINKRLMDLQSKELEASRTAQLINSIAGITTAGLNVASAIGDLVQQKQLQESKSILMQADREIKEAMNKALLSGNYKVQEIDGKVVFPETPKEVTDIISKYEQDVKDRGYWSKVQGFWKESLSNSFNQAAGSATNAAVVQFAQIRDKAEAKNRADAIKISVEAGNTDAIEAHNFSLDWKSEEEKKILLDDSLKQWKFGVTQKDLTGLASSESYASAMQKFESVKGGFSQEDQDRLRVAVAKADKDAYNAALSEADKTYTELTADKKDELGKVVTPGIAGADVIRGIEASWNGREADKVEVVGELRKKQDATEWNNSFSLYDKSRNDPVALKENYDRIKSGDLLGRYDGIEKTHKMVLDMFESRMEYFKPKDATEADYTREMAMVYAAWENEVPGPTGNKPSTQAAIAKLYQIGSQGGSTSQMFDFIGKMRAGGKQEYAPIFAGLEEFYDLQIKSIKDNIPERGEASRRRDENMQMLSALAGKQDTNQDVLTTAAQRIKDLEVASRLKDVRFILDTGARNRFGSSDVAKVVNAAQRGELDDVVYIDNQGNTRFTRGKGTFEQLMSASEQMLIEAGAPVKPGSSRFTKQDNVDDVGAYWTAKGTDGKTYGVRSFDNGKSVKPAVMDDKTGEWKDITPKGKPNKDQTSSAVVSMNQEKKLQDDTKSVAMQNIEKIQDREDRLDEMRKWVNAGVITWKELEASGYDRRGNKRVDLTGAKGGGR